tara:strand:+ start:77 stop:1189 length:1113 start_codon:yes stop_codon:yes gene_type:complete
MSLIVKTTKAAAKAAKALEKAKKKAEAAKKKAAAAKKKAASAKKKTTATKKKGKQGKAMIQAPVRGDRSRGESINEEVAGTREVSGFTGRAEKDIEQGKAGKVNSGSKSVVSFYDLERGNPVRRKQAKRVAALETKETKGTITKDEKTELDKLDAASKKADTSRTAAASKTRGEKTSAAKGVTLKDFETGKLKTVGKKEKQPSGQMIGDTKNGINRVTGEPFGNPTPNQIAMAIRDLNARTKLSAEQKRNLAKLEAMSKRDKQDRTLRMMERKMKDTGKDRPRDLKKGGMAMKNKKDSMYKDGGMPMVMKDGKKIPAYAADGVGKMMKGGMAKKKKVASNYAYGGMTKAKPRTGSTDYRMGGMFMKKGKK